MAIKQINQVPIAQLAPHPHNARTHSSEQIGQIADSIDAFGFVNPVLIDADNGSSPSSVDFSRSGFYVRFTPNSGHRRSPVLFRGIVIRIEGNWLDLLTSRWLAGYWVTDLR